VTKVVLHIDRLVLKELQRSDAAAITAGLQQELQTRLAGTDARAALAEQGNIGTLSVGEVKLERHGDASSIGKALASRIIGGEQ